MSAEEPFHLEKPTISSFGVTLKATGYQKGTPTRRYLPYMPWERKGEASVTVIKKDIAYFFGKYLINIISPPMLSFICFWFQCNVQAVHTAEWMNWDRAPEAEHVLREHHPNTAELQLPVQQERRNPHQEHSSAEWLCRFWRQHTHMSLYYSQIGMQK